jgi:Putative beta-barrel porin-2, OmpL-like. bbp2
MRLSLIRSLSAIGLFVSVPAAAFAQNAPTAQATSSDQGFLQRLFNAYADEFNPPPPTPAAQTAAAASGRLPPPFPPAPLSAPPWPWTDWPFNGTPSLGGSTPNSEGNNLMKALDGTPTGDFLKDNHIEVWGWVDAGANLSTSHGRNGNAPAGYDFNPNTAQLNQAVIYVERLPDTTQFDHIDRGFRIINLYGTDYREVTMEGIASDALTKHNALYGYTSANFYGDLYIPWIGQGSDLRFGRYTTLPDIEADLDYQSVFDTHSLQYTYDPFTQFGAAWSTRLSRNWMVQVGLNAGNDVAPWEADARPTTTACLQYNSDSSWDNVYICDNGSNNAKFGFNNVNLYEFVWYHKITDRLWAATEDYYEYQRDVPTVSTIPGAPSTGDGMYGRSILVDSLPHVSAHGQGLHRLAQRAFDDVRGQRTGFAGWYSENTLGWTHWLSPSIEVRPEIRYDHFYNGLAYDNGMKKNQLAVASDIIIKF